MANNFIEGRFIVDSTGALVNPDIVITITGINIFASNATWAVTINDVNGNTVFKASNVAGVNGQPLVKPFSVTQPVIATLTNATLVIYTE